MITTSAPFLEALSADGPAPEYPRELMLYGQFIGEWTVQVTDHDSENGPTTGTGRWCFGWVLQGRAVQDVFIVPPGTTRPRYGTTVRVYDPRAGVWHVRWHNPLSQAYNTLIGRQVGTGIVQEGTGEDGAPIRWSFTDITPESFRWLGEISRDGGRTWELQAEFFARRVAR